MTSHNLCCQFLQIIQKIVSPVHQQFLAAAVIVDLENRRHLFPNLIIELAQRITDSRIALYSQIKLIRSDHEISNLEEPDFKNRYFQALETLFSIPVSLEILKFINK